MKKLLVIVLSLSVALLGVGCSQPSQQTATPAPTVTTAAEKPAGPVKVMKIGSVNAKSRALSQGLYKFEEYLEKETNGSINVEVFTDGVLGDDRRTLEGLQIGSIQGTTVSTGPISAFVPSIGVFDLPFLFKDAETAYRVLDGPIGQEQLDALEGSGFIGLAYWENGWRHVSNSKREITTLEDMKGLKIRTMESPIHVDTWKALGTNPTPMSFSQLYTALEQKVVDGQENPLANVVSNKLDEVQKFITTDGHLYGASPFMVSKVFWDTLSDDEKAAVKKVAIMVRDDERKMAQDEDKAAIETLTKNGVKISELAPGEKDKIKAVLQVIYDKYKGQFGETLMNKVLEATK